MTAKGTIKLVCKHGHLLSGDNLYVTPQGFRQCRACRAAWEQQHGTNYAKTHPKEAKAYRQKWNTEHPFYGRDGRYGMPDGWFESKLAEQNNCCACCGDPFTKDNVPHVDHDHACCPRGNNRKCGKCTRDLLCTDCNLGIGRFRDDASRVQKALAYVQRWKP